MNVLATLFSKSEDLENIKRYLTTDLEKTVKEGVLLNSVARTFYFLSEEVLKSEFGIKLKISSKNLEKATPDKIKGLLISLGNKLSLKEDALFMTNLIEGGETTEETIFDILKTAPAIVICSPAVLNELLNSHPKFSNDTEDETVGAIGSIDSTSILFSPIITCGYISIQRREDIKTNIGNLKISMVLPKKPKMETSVIAVEKMKVEIFFPSKIHKSLKRDGK